MIVQFKNEGDSVDVDWLFDFHEVLQDLLKRNKCGTLDGNDFGKGTINMYIVTKSLESAFDLVLINLKLYRLDSRAIIVKRHKLNQYTVLWPEDFTGEFSES
jgi:hypothetical protein